MCKKCMTSSLLRLVKSFMSKHILFYQSSCKKHRIFHVHGMTAGAMEIAMVVSGYNSIVDLNYYIQE